MFHRIKAWRQRRHGEIRHSLRLTVAALIAYAVGETLALPQAYWSVFTAVLVTQASVGGSVKAALDWLMGTLGGGVYAALVDTVIVDAGPVATGVGLAIALVPLAFLAAVRPTFRFAPVTGVIIILVAPAQQLSAIEAATNRLAEIALGGFIGLLVSLLFLPAKASHILNQTAARTLENLATILPLLTHFDRAHDQTELTARHDAVLTQMAKVTLAVEEAGRERASHLSNAPDPEPILRTLQRLRADIIMLGRATASPFPPAFHERLAQALAGAANAVEDSLRGMGASLEARRTPPTLDAVEAAIARYAREVSAVREAGFTRGLTGELVGRTFAVGFALEQLKINMADMASRIQERVRKVEKK